MRKQVWLGGALVSARRPFEADKAFEALEGEFNAPPETIERQNIGSSEFVRCERGEENDPLRGEKRTLRDLMSAFRSLPSRFTSRRLGGLRRLLYCDKA